MTGTAQARHDETSQWSWGGRDLTGSRARHEEQIADGDSHVDAPPGDEHARFARDHAEGAEHHKALLDAILALETHINE